MFAAWLHVLSILALGVGGVCALVAAIDQSRHPQHMWVMNAGYGYLAAIEEGDDADIRALFETDQFGPLSPIKAALPGMRARRRGHIVNISSIGGLVTFPGVGYYHMVKFGLEAMSETLAKEVVRRGIDVTVVAPGAFRTDFRSPTSMKQSAARVDDYGDTAGKGRAGIQAGHVKQAGDPARGARAIIAAVEAAPHPSVDRGRRARIASRQA